VTDSAVGSANGEGVVSAPPLLYIVVRRTTDWRNEAGVRAQLPDRFVGAFDLWNATFDMPYHVFRCELKRIAALSHARVEGAVVAAFEDVPDGALIAPTDDDDWFAPALAREVLRNRVDSCEGYHWPSRFLEVPTDLRHRLALWRRRLSPGRPLGWICTTNNYVLAKREDCWPLLESHVRASEWFGQHAAAVKTLDRPLSLQNRNLASQTSLSMRRRTMTRWKLVRKYREYRCLYARAVAPGLEWCRPYMALMAELMENLHVRST